MNAFRTMTDDELGSALEALGREVSWPATRDVAPAVIARVERMRVPERPRYPWLASLRGPGGGASRTLGRSLVLAALALLAVVALATAFGIGVPGIRIFFGPVASPSPTLPASTPGATAATAATAAPGGSPSPSGTLGPSATDDPALGRRVSLDEARSGAGFGVLTPTNAGFAHPDAVHLLGAPPIARVALSYGDRGSVTEFIGAADPLGFEKMIGSGTTVESLTLNGHAAFWISGAPHELFIYYRDGSGSPVWDSMIVTGNVLVWQAGEVTLRFVTPLGRAEAVAVADSMR